MKKEPIMQQPQTIEPSIDDSLSLEAILEEARELRRQKAFVQEKPLSETGTNEEQAVQQGTVEENQPDETKTAEEDPVADASLQQKEEEALPSPIEEKSEQGENKEDRRGFFSSIRSFFQGKAKDEDDEPDEMMIKYGEISLGSANKQEEKQEDSFFFQERAGDEGEPEELSNEFSTIFEEIQQGRRLDREIKGEKRGEMPAEPSPLEQPSEREEEAAVLKTSHLEPEGQEGSLEGRTQPEKKEELSETVLQQLPEEEAGSSEEQAEGSRTEDVPAQPEAAVQKELTEEERETAQSLEAADRLISQDYVTGDISLEEVIENAKKLMQQRIVPFGQKTEDSAETEACPQTEKKACGRQSDEETEFPEDISGVSADTMEWDIFQAVSTRLGHHPQKPKPAHRAPVPGSSAGYREKQAAGHSDASQTPEQPDENADQTGKTAKEKREGSREKNGLGHSNPTRKFDVVKGGQAPQPIKNSPKRKRKRAHQNSHSHPKPHKEHFRLFGDVEPEGPPLEEPKADEVEYIDDYTEPGDAFSVRAEIVGNVRRLLLRTAATAVLTILGVALAVTQRLEAPNPASFLAEHVYLYPIFNLLLLLLAAGCCYVPIGNGLASLVKLRGNSDSAIAFAMLTAVVHGIFAFLSPQPYITGSLSLYTPMVVLGLFLNSAGKFTMVRRIQQNFKFVSAPDRKQAVKIVTDSKRSEKMCTGMGLQAPLVAYSRKSGFLTDFLRLSYEPDSSEKLAAKLAPFGVLLSLAVGIGSFAATQDIQQAVTSLAITACLCVPFCCELALNHPLRRLCRRLNRQGAMLVGYPGVQQFADVNVVQIDASELYPRGSVVLHGIKTFSGQRIDESILQAAAIMCMVGGPLASTFDQIIQGKGDILPRVEALDYEDEMGIVAWVGGVRVLLGNRRLLEEHGIAPPSLDYEKKYLTGQRQATYLASGGDLVAMFVVTYHPDAAVMEELQRLEDNGVSLLVSTYDSNITATMISNHYKLAFRSVKVLPYAESRLFEDLKAEKEERTRAYAATRGKASVMHRMIAACVRFKGNSSLSLVLQVTSVVFSILLVGLLTIFGGLTQIGTLEILLYVLFWSAAVLIVPFLRKP